MKKNLRNYFIVLLLSIFTMSCSDKRDDEKIKESVTEKLQGNDNWKTITAEVQDGIVTLTGDCSGDDCAKQVQQEIEAVDGVQSVQNNIKNNSETDLTLRTSVQAIISKYQGVQADVAGGMVVLRGTINRDQIQPLMNELQSLQPKKIDNQLAIQ